MYDENRLDIEYDSSIGEYVDTDGNIYYNYRYGSYGSGSGSGSGSGADAGGVALMIIMALFLPIMVYTSKRNSNQGNIPPIIRISAIMNMLAIVWGIFAVLIFFQFVDLSTYFSFNFDRLVFFLLTLNFFGITLIIIHYIFEDSKKIELDTYQQVFSNLLVLSACSFWGSLIIDIFHKYVDDFYGLPQLQDLIINCYNLIYYGYVVAFILLAIFIVQVLIKYPTLFNISFTVIVAFTASAMVASSKYFWYKELFEKMYKIGICFFILIIFIKVCHSMFIKKN